jgi:hypothetical protein
VGAGPPTPNPQSPIPNPQSPFIQLKLNIILSLKYYLNILFYIIIKNLFKYNLK